MDNGYIIAASTVVDRLGRVNLAVDCQWAAVSNIHVTRNTGILPNTNDKEAAKPMLKTKAQTLTGFKPGIEIQRSLGPHHTPKYRYGWISIDDKDALTRLQALAHSSKEVWILWARSRLTIIMYIFGCHTAAWHQSLHGLRVCIQACVFLKSRLNAALS